MESNRQQSGRIGQSRWGTLGAMPFSTLLSIFRQIDRRTQLNSRRFAWQLHAGRPMSHQGLTDQTRRQRKKHEFEKCWREQKQQLREGASHGSSKQRRQCKRASREDGPHQAINQGQGMTYRQILLRLAVGEHHTFETLDKAKSASAAACKLYGINRTFSRVGETLTRTS